MTSIGSTSRFDKSMMKALFRIQNEMLGMGE